MCEVNYAVGSRKGFIMRKKKQDDVRQNQNQNKEPKRPIDIDENESVNGDEVVNENVDGDEVMNESNIPDYPSFSEQIHAPVIFDDSLLGMDDDDNDGSSYISTSTTSNTSTPSQPTDKLVFSSSNMIF